MINKADDTSFEELGEMFSELIELGKEIEKKKDYQLKLLDEVLNESIRLQKQGYDLSNINFTIKANN